MVRWLLAAVHLLALGIGLGSVWARARLLGAPTLDTPTLRRALTADAWWGVAAILWVGSGLWRLLAGTEKTTAYYLENHAFWAKMALLAAILVLESGPIVTLERLAPPARPRARRLTSAPRPAWPASATCRPCS